MAWDTSLVLGPLFLSSLSWGVTFPSDLSLKLEGRGVWKSGVSLGNLTIKPVNVVLSPSLPFFFASDSPSWSGSWVLNISIELKSGGIRDSGVGLSGLSIKPVDMILSPVLPLLLSSHCPGGSSRILSSVCNSKKESNHSRVLLHYKLI